MSSLVIVSKLSNANGVFGVGGILPNPKAVFDQNGATVVSKFGVLSKGDDKACRSPRLGILFRGEKRLEALGDRR